ncbi:MAG: type IV pilin [Euryarchaeota archaeon]|nr:type IV pilin [Euryarchaeota archaeon]
MKKNWKNRKGVSPVIATILMVAITVVLAAVLYVMVMGFGGDEQASITGSFTDKQKIGDTEKIRFGKLTPSIDGSKISLRVDVTGPDGFDTADVLSSATYKWDAGAKTWILSSPAAVGPVKAVANDAEGIPTVIPIEFFDLAGDGYISSGDYILITHAVEESGVAGSPKAGTYNITVSMLDANTGSLIDSIEYSWVVAAKAA